MSKRFIAYLVVFLITFLSFFYTELFYFKNPTAAPMPKPAPSPFANLSFAPNPLIATASAITSMNVLLETNSTPTIIQLEIAYDPNSLYNINLFPGDYFIDPKIHLEKTDYKNGRISYAVGGKSIKSNSNKVATINFTPVNYWLKKEITMKFLPKTSVKMGSVVIELKKTPGANIIIKP